MSNIVCIKIQISDRDIPLGQCQPILTYHPPFFPFFFYFFIDVLQIPLSTVCTKYYCDKKIVSYLNNKCQLSPSLLTIGWASSWTELVVRSQRTLSPHRLRTISFTFSSPFLQSGIKPPPLIQSRNLTRGDSETACCSWKLLYRSKKWRRKRLDFAGFKILPARICMAELATSYTETCPRGERTRRIPESLKSCVWLQEKPGDAGTGLLWHERSFLSTEHP